jgi:DNA-binding transcriptional LysR family regulator
MTNARSPAAPHVAIDDARLAKAEAFIEAEEGATNRFRGWLGTLVTVLEDFEDAPRPIHVVYPHARLLPARTRAFIDFIRQELKGFAPGNTPS